MLDSILDDKVLGGSEEHFRANFEQPAVGIVHSALDGRFLLLSQRFCSIVGYSLEELREQTFRTITHPDDLAASEALLQQLVEGAVPTRTLEKRYIHKSGETVWARLTVSLLRAPSGEPWQILSVVEDVTARKLSEALVYRLNASLEQRVAARTTELLQANLQLREQIAERERAEACLRDREAQYRMLIEQSLQVVMIVQEQGLVFANPAIETMSGYEVAELLAMPAEVLFAIIHPDDRQSLLERLHARLAGQLLPTPSQVRFVNRNGAMRWASLEIGRIEYRGRPALQVVAVDITALKEAEAAVLASHNMLNRINAELSHALQLKDAFLANMSHELRTPLNNILGRAELLEEEIYGPISERQRKAIGSICESGYHLLGLISDILDLSKAESGQLALDLGPVPIEELCLAALQAIRPGAGRRSLSLAIDLDPESRTVTGDARRLRQILVSLLANAVKFTPEGGRICLEVHGDRLTPTIRFTVSDTGIGIAREELPSLFQPFIQLDYGLARSYEGLGLGLALVARLTTLHGGSINVESEPGRGSRFTVTLPSGAPAPPPDRPDAACRRQVEVD